MIRGVHCAVAMVIGGVHCAVAMVIGMHVMETYKEQNNGENYCARNGDNVIK